MSIKESDPSGSVRSTRLKIWRGTNRDHGHYDVFDVEYEDGDSVLDALVRLRVEEPDLAFRYSCFNANVCKECIMLIDGRVEYACITKLTPGVTQLDPLPNRAVLRDLITATLSPKELI